MKALFHRSWGRDDRGRRWWEVTLFAGLRCWCVGVDVDIHGTIEREVRVYLPMLCLSVWWQDGLPALRSAA